MGCRPGSTTSRLGIRTRGTTTCTYFRAAKATTSTTRGICRCPLRLRSGRCTRGDCVTTSPERQGEGALGNFQRVLRSSRRTAGGAAQAVLGEVEVDEDAIAWHKVGAVPCSCQVLTGPPAGRQLEVRRSFD